MKKINFVPVVFMLLMASAFLACHKNNPTIANITVLDTINKPVSQAFVILWQDTLVSPVNGQTSNIRQSKYTDNAGKCSFEFPNEAFLNIEVIKNGDTVRDVIQLREHYEQNKTVKFER